MNKFSEGEIVILQSKSLPEHNGEYSIYKILPPNEDFVCRLTGTVLYCVEGISYILDEPLIDLIQCDGAETVWGEWSLKKKHEGSDFSFTQLMAHMKTKIVENI